MQTAKTLNKGENNRRMEGTCDAFADQQKVERRAILSNTVLVLSQTMYVSEIFIPYATKHVKPYLNYLVSCIKIILAEEFAYYMNCSCQQSFFFGPVCNFRAVYSTWF